MGISDKVVCVAGATGSLGAVVARTFLHEGARLVLTGRDSQRLQALAAELCAQKDQGCLWIPADTGETGSVDSLVKGIEDRFGRLDVLLNAVGGYVGGQPSWEIADETWAHAWQLNVKSCVTLNRAVLPSMLAHKWGRIVNVGSKTALEPRKNSAAYTATKAAVIALTQSIAVEVKGTGVTANVLLPSVIDSPANRESNPNADPSRWVRAEQLAAAMLFLCSEEGGAINGAAIPIYAQV